MAKLSTYVEPLTSVLGGLTNSSSGGGSVSIVSSAAEMNAGSTGGDAARIETGVAFADDIDDDAVYWQVVALPTAGRVDFTIVDAEEDGYRIRLDATNILISRMAAGTPTTVSGPTAWSSGSHKWIRFRETSGTFFVEGAPDSGSNSPGTFSTIYSEATNTNASFTHTAVDATWFMPFISAATFRFRYLNTSAQSPVPRLIYQYRRRR